LILFLELYQQFVSSGKLLGAAFRALEDWWYRTSLRPTDSPNCETETADRTLQTGSLTVPADGYRIKCLDAVIVI